MLGVRPGQGSRDFGTPTALARPHPFASRSGAGTNRNGSRAPRRTGRSGAEAPMPPRGLCRWAPPGASPPASPILAVPSPHARRRLSLSSPSLLPAPVSSALPRFQAPLHSKVVTNFQLRPGEPNGAENAPNLQPGPSARLPAGPVPAFPGRDPPHLLLSASLAPLRGRGAQGTHAELAPGGMAGLGQPEGWCQGRGCRAGGVLAHPLGAHRLGRPSRVRFSDPEGNVLFEHPVQKSAAPEDGMVRGAGRAGGCGTHGPVGLRCPPGHCPALPSPTALRDVEDGVQGQHTAAARGAAPRVPRHPGAALRRGPWAYPQAPSALRG